MEELFSKYRIAVIGLGYVGLPIAVAFAQQLAGTIGFDLKKERVEQLQNGIDQTGEIDSEILKTTSLKVTDKLEDIAECNFYIIAVPTPLTVNHQPDLNSLKQASQMMGTVLKDGDIVVYESTVYPGVTEEICGKILAETSGLKQGIDFKLGYSPERINPGDCHHTLENIVKVVAGEDQATLEQIATVYSAVIPAGIYRATSIKVAEAAKVIENIQRDLNIALMNELAIIFDRMNIRTDDVLAAARTKWNFLDFNPGLVGGHCIGVDPYYLTTKAEQLGYNPEVILAGRRINDSMGAYLAQRLVKLLTQANLPILGARVGILGLTFKENVPDLRNSRVPDMIAELNQFGINPLVHDPLADTCTAQREYGINLISWSNLRNLGAIVLAVPHFYYLQISRQELFSILGVKGVLMDVKSVIDPSSVPSGVHYWSL